MDKTVILNKEAVLSEGAVSSSAPRERVNKENFMKTDIEKRKLKLLKAKYKQSLNNK